MINLFFLLVGCSMHRGVQIGVIDIIDGNICSIQLESEETIEVNRSFCKGLKEGDVIKAVRQK